jgi:hypothetical protein
MFEGVLGSWLVLLFGSHDVVTPSSQFFFSAGSSRSSTTINVQFCCKVHACAVCVRMEMGAAMSSGVATLSEGRNAGCTRKQCIWLQDVIGCCSKGKTPELFGKTEWRMEVTDVRSRELRDEILCQYERTVDETGETLLWECRVLQQVATISYEAFAKTFCFTLYTASACILHSYMYTRGPFAKFVDSPYYSESELCGGAVTVSFPKYLGWRAMHFLQRYPHFSKTCCRPLMTSKFLASELHFHGWKSPEIAWGEIWIKFCVWLGRSGSMEPH